MRNKIAITKNILALTVALAKAQENVNRKENIIIVVGEPGAGKTEALDFTIKRAKGVFLYADPTWTGPSMLEDLVKALGGVPHRTQSGNKAIAIDLLKKRRRPVGIDEADSLSDALLDILRSVHDNAGAPPFIFVAMKGCVSGLCYKRRFVRRTKKVVKFFPVAPQNPESKDTPDTVTLAKALTDVDIDVNLLEKLREEANGNIGLIKNGIENIEEIALQNKLSIPVTIEEWGARELFVPLEASLDW